MNALSSNLTAPKDHQSKTSKTKQRSLIVQLSVRQDNDDMSAEPNQAN